MRAACIVLLLLGCTGENAATLWSCPSSEPDSGSLIGMPCAVSTDHTCFVLNEFSGCDSAYYRCVDGAWAYDHEFDPSDGASCTDAPVTACSYEGNEDCVDAPTAEACSCGGDGLWHCTCACYGTETTCPIECPSEFPGAGSDGPACSDVGTVCSYSGHLCSCADTGLFQCT
jgi:hypothetical protein